VEVFTRRKRKPGRAEPRPGIADQLRQSQVASQIRQSPLAREARRLTIERARRSRREVLLLLPLLVMVVVAFHYRVQLFGLDTPVRVVSAIALGMLGWALARDVGRVAGPALLRRLEPGTANTLSFVIRLFTLGVASLVALRFAGLDPETLAVGGAVTAVILGLAAQQTLGNLIAGVVLLGARPFDVGSRVRLQGGGLAGQLEGTVGGLGLLYTTLRRGEDTIMVPNNVVLTSAVVPLREPAGIDLRARLRPGVRPSQVQELLHDVVTTPTRTEPHIGLEEIDADEVVVRIAATPEAERDGPKLADEILAAIDPVTRDDHEPSENERAAAARAAERN